MCHRQRSNSTPSGACFLVGWGGGDRSTNQNLKAGGVSGTSRMPIPTELVYVWRDVEGVDPYGSVGGILKLVLVNYSLHGLRSPHPSARLHLIEFCNFRGSHPPSPQWEGSVWRKFACSLLNHYSPTNHNLKVGGKPHPLRRWGYLKAGARSTPIRCINVIVEHLINQNLRGQIYIDFLDVIGNFLILGNWGIFLKIRCKKSSKM